MRARNEIGLIDFVLWILVLRPDLSSRRTTWTSTEAFPSDSNLMRVLEMMERFPGREPRSRVYFVLGMAGDGTCSDRPLAGGETDPRLRRSDMGSSFRCIVASCAAHADCVRAFRGNSLVNSAAYHADPREQGVWCFMDHFKAWVEEMEAGHPSLRHEPLLAGLRRCRRTRRATVW